MSKTDFRHYTILARSIPINGNEVGEAIRKVLTLYKPPTDQYYFRQLYDLTRENGKETYSMSAISDALKYLFKAGIMKKWEDRIKEGQTKTRRVIFFKMKDPYFRLLQEHRDLLLENSD